MRLFTGLALPPETVARLERLLSGLWRVKPVSWTPPENWHITTKFIGEWPEKRLDQLDNALARIKAGVAFPVEIGQWGWFPNASSPKVLWAGVNGGDALMQLAEATEECVTELGITREEKPYNPHLTIARIKSVAPLDQQLRRKIEELEPTTIGNFVASSFHLFSSEPASHASIYRMLREYRFEQAT